MVAALFMAALCISINALTVVEMCQLIFDISLLFDNVDFYE